MSTYSSRDALDSCASYFPTLKQKGGGINFLKGMYAVPKEVIWEMERELLKTGASAPLKSQSHDLSIFTQAVFLGLLHKNKNKVFAKKNNNLKIN